MSGTTVGASGLHNRRVIMDAIRVNGPLSRAALARATHLSKQTLSNIIDDLENEGLVAPLERVTSGRGKPATPYTLAPQGAFAIGLQIDRHIARCVAVDLVGQIQVRRDTELYGKDTEKGFATLLDLIATTQADLAALHPQSPDRIVGLGVAMPGPFGRRASVEDDDYAMSRWQSYPLRRRLEEVTGLPVSLQNDAAAATTAEKLIGRAHSLRNVACVYFGYGLGAGLILNGELYTGVDGNAGEIGMIPDIGPNGRNAPLEHNASLASFCLATGLDPSAPDLFSLLEERLALRPPEVEAWLEAAAEKLGWLADLLALTLSPQAIILCGTAPPRLISILTEMVAARRGQVAALPRLLAGQANPWIVAIGAAADPIRLSFDPRYAALLKE